ncbi:MAG TPA: helix-turn-helix domain-containing protein [Myxococcaceae bacterium]|jgi:DNA-binding HxlR family transcriptional regulator
MQGNRHCAVETTVNVIGGKWKPLILYFLFFEGTQRFNSLLGQVGAPRQALTVQLRELERDGLIERRVFPEVPPRVEYSLTPLGQSLGPVLQGMLEWGERYERERPGESAGKTGASEGGS